MKEYKFRGKDIETGEWIYGGIDSANECISITCGRERYISIDKKTVGQYTGFKDENSVEIYEGDILEGGYLNPLENKFLSRKYLIEYREGVFLGILIGHSPYGDTLLKFINGEVIGNIYETPELLEEIQ